MGGRSLSTDEVDRHGDLVSVGGWRLQAYRRNPVFLWAHDYTQPAIGRALAVWKEGHSLRPGYSSRRPTSLKRWPGSIRGDTRVVSRLASGPSSMRSEGTPVRGRAWASSSWSRSCWRSAPRRCQPTRTRSGRPWTPPPRMRSYYRGAGFVGGAESEDALPPRFRTYAGQGGVGGPAPVPWERALAEILDALRYAG